jgi:serine phosphatase RsbU (regulator of sigma subunit)
VEAEWCFQPSAQLGGDAFGYHWLDQDHLAIYLIDVCGHGVGAALLSISVLNALRSQTLGGAEFTNPASVLGALNRTFPMEKQNNLFFTAWYGVYRASQRSLTFCSGGHPPALLLEPRAGGLAQVVALQTEAPAVGCFDEAHYVGARQPIAPGSRLLVFTDGVYEIFEGSTRAGTWQEFLESFQDPKVQGMRPHERLLQARLCRGADFLEDDYSLIELRFP